MRDILFHPIQSHAMAMFLAMALDVALGWPQWLYAGIGHPVSWLGRFIGWGDRIGNREGASFGVRRLAGTVLTLTAIGMVTGLALAITRLLPMGWSGTLLTGVLAWPLLALRSLRDHVAAVARPLVAGDLPEARRAVSMIVGRDPEQLDAAAIARAAAESLAENTSDGIVAPLFWGILFGLPGIAAYKAINTLDSMIAYRTDRHLAFGWAAARIDDIANWLPARLTGLLFVLASSRPRATLATMLRDARAHRSPNAGWPEAAFAGALGFRLSGPRVYGDRMTDDPWLNGAAPDPSPQDLLAGLHLYRRAMAVLALAVVTLAGLAGGFA